MIVQWCTVSFSYFMMGFQMKYIPGNVYLNLEDFKKAHDDFDKAISIDKNSAKFHHAKGLAY